MAINTRAQVPEAEVTKKLRDVEKEINETIFVGNNHRKLMDATYKENIILRTELEKLQKSADEAVALIWEFKEALGICEIMDKYRFWDNHKDFDTVTQVVKARDDEIILRAKEL